MNNLGQSPLGSTTSPLIAAVLLAFGVFDRVHEFHARYALRGVVVARHRIPPPKAGQAHFLGPTSCRTLQMRQPDCEPRAVVSTVMVRSWTTEGSITAASVAEPTTYERDPFPVRRPWTARTEGLPRAPPPCSTRGSTRPCLQLATALRSRARTESPLPSRCATRVAHGYDCAVPREIDVGERAWLTAP